jgi:hypothetical protein
MNWLATDRTVVSQTSGFLLKCTLILSEKRSANFTALLSKTLFRTPNDVPKIAKNIVVWWKMYFLICSVNRGIQTRNPPTPADTPLGDRALHRCSREFAFRNRSQWVAIPWGALSANNTAAAGLSRVPHHNHHYHWDVLRPRRGSGTRARTLTRTSAQVTRCEYTR